MPDKEVENIKELIFYQYSKVIAKSTFELPDGIEAKHHHYGFVKSTFRSLKYGNKTWSEITREDKQLVESEKKCNYCSSNGELQWEHIVPKSLQIKPECSACEKIQAIHNLVLACPSCNASKGTLGLYEYYKKIRPDTKKYYNIIPKLLEKKYLKTIYNCHECAGTLDKYDVDGDGKLTVLDLDYILH